MAASRAQHAGTARRRVRELDGNLVARAGKHAAINRDFELEDQDLAFYVQQAGAFDLCTASAQPFRRKTEEHVVP